MKKDSGSIYRVFLMLGDALAIVFSFAFAYYIRTHIDSRPYYFTAEQLDFTVTVLSLIPIWWLILAMLGLYKKSIILGRSRFSELGRLLTASIIGIMTIITYDFFYEHNLFPVRIVAVWSALLCFLSLLMIRFLLREIRFRLIVHTGRATLNVIIIGYRVVGVVASPRYIPDGLKKYKRSSLKDALEKSKPDIIFQTDELQTEYVYGQAINAHAFYYFVPSDSTLSSHIGSMELIGDTPAILVKVTPLIGGARVAKRAMDLIFGAVLFIFALIPMFFIWLAEKISDPSHPALYSEYRLSRYNKKVRIYKFRSMKPEYSGLSPEEAFEKMGKPGLIATYRENGDYLKNDPRITRLGRFIRATSLDELPQLWNVLRGDISLVGPRALVPGELRDYGDRSLLLSVKSGLTGLAQVSGRRDISFEERRALDIYYIQNWSVLLDIQILLRTIIAVLFRKGAK